MPLLRVKEAIVERLTNQPESGIGYQVVRFRGSGLVIFNATVAIPLDDLRTKPLDSDDYEILSGDPDSEAVRNAESLAEDGEFVVAFSQFAGVTQQDEFGLSFSETAVEPPPQAVFGRAPCSFYRFSSYFKDKRVSSGGDFLPGTYATTYADLPFVPSGFAAVGRYALPNPASARFLFSITTLTRPALMGTATPNYGQAGGGVEVFFANGAKNQPGASFPIPIG